MSAETLKQLKIKTSMVKRLKKEYISYDKETKGIANKITALQAEPQTEESQYEVKKQKEFLAESESVLSNVKQKFIESFEALATFMSEKQGDQTLQGTEEKNNAQQVVLDAETFLQGLGE